MSVREYYETYWEQSGYAGNRSLHPFVRELFERHVNSGDRCIDVGCGDGGMAGEWLSRNGGSYVGVDVASTAVEATQARGLDARLVDDAGDLPFEPESFDLAVCIEVLEHLFDPAAAMGEMRRLVRPGGLVIATVPNIAHWRTRVDLAVLGRWAGRGDAQSADVPWLDPHIRFFTLKSFNRLVASSGFDVVESGGFSQSGLLQSVPGLRKLARSGAPSRLTVAISRLLPRLFASGIFVVASRPDRAGQPA